jgi:hypothetical protein
LYAKYAFENTNKNEDVEHKHNGNGYQNCEIKGLKFQPTEFIAYSIQVWIVDENPKNG